MEVELLCSSRELFGADRSALRLAGVLRTLGHAPRLVLPSHRPEAGLSDAARRQGVPVREGALTIASSGGVERPLARLAAPKRTVDVVVVNSTAVVDWDVRCRYRILMVREWLEPKSPRHRALGLRHRIGLSAVIGVSSGVLEQWREVVRGPSRQFVVHNWLDSSVLEAARPSLGSAGIICLGRFNCWKGQDVLAAAYERAFSDTPTAPRLTFVGAQPATPFAPAADAIKARGTRWGWRVVDFTPDPSPHLADAALLVMPSLHPEPFGVVALEALAQGCRVLAFPGGGADDLSRAFPGVVTTVPRSPEALALALRRWWQDGGSAQQLQEADRTRETLRRQFSHEGAVQHWRRVLTRVRSPDLGR